MSGLGLLDPPLLYKPSAKDTRQTARSLVWCIPVARLVEGYVCDRAFCQVAVVIKDDDFRCEIGRG